MIDAWTWPAYIAILLGLSAFVVLFVPILVIESRRWGQIRLARLIAAALIAVYGVALIAYTLLPFPDADWCATNPVPGRNLTPFAFVDDIRTQTAGESWRATLTSFAFLQVAFNVLLFAPWGAFLRRFYGRGVLLSTASGLVVSALIESIQGTGAFGAFGCAYRVADVDDVITNTAGAFVGALIAPLVLFWLPDPRRAGASRGLPRPVTRRRRLAGMLIDLGLFTLVPIALTVAHRAVVVYLLGEPIPGDDGWTGPFLWTALWLALGIYLPSAIGSGASLGQRAVWLEPTWQGRRHRCGRMLVGFGTYATLSALAMAPPFVGSAQGDVLNAASLLVAVVWLGWMLFDRTARGASFRLTGATVADARGSAPVTSST
ncbi:VanZ family protein [Aeromicrobium piscarium]|uniref:VanZ family protein n=1 Tax=Aeromicrobium piscarium TaxID=2590901 RepID=A0A554SBC2_9ACTN|nr:VanZ family protein [Aeromicrobium piscarium]TSD63648.1 VanZ family protein [Aeromicrobium piscarium]